MKKVLVAAVLAPFVANIVGGTVLAGEPTEAEKKAIEAEKKAAELAAEPPREEDTEVALTEEKATEVEKKAAELAAEPPQEEDTEVAMTEEEKKALEAAKKAAETQGGTQGTNPPATGKLSGRITAITGDSISVGIIGDNSVTVTSRTYVTFNGQISNLLRLKIADSVSVKYDLETNTATSIEAEGFPFDATYKDVTTVAYLGLIGHTPGLHFAMVTANGAGVKLGPGTEVTINGQPATYLDIRVGDHVDYVQNALDPKAFWVKVSR